MRFITIRDFRSNSAQIQRDLLKENEMILTSNGKPIAILSATTADGVEKLLNMIRRVRAMEAVDYIQRKSMEKGADRMSLEAINKEIIAVRTKRRTK